MPCEQFKDELIETAIGGAEPQGELREHLNACASCRGSFAKERALFSAIDSGLHAAVNTDVPPSLLPLVRVNLDETIVAPRRWFVSWPVLTGASLVAATLLVFVVVHQNHVGAPAVNSAGNRTAVPEAASPTQSSASSLQRDGISRPSMRAASAPVPLQQAASQTTPEVLVPHDQELLLAGYAQEWISGKRAPLIAKDAKETAVALLEVPPIQITELDVKLLAEGDSQ